MDRILVVGDSIQFNDLVSHWLSQDDSVGVYTAESGLNALAKAEIFAPDIVITNVELPDMSGFDLCKRLKALSKNMLVMCLSHLENDACRLRALEVADDYMETKTGDHFQFMSKVRNLLRVKHLSNQIRQQYAELEARNTVMERHMQMGRKVQRALIPEIKMDFRGSRMMSRYYPAMDVGGDFYSVLKLSDSCMGIVMGDVSGHGIAASFLTVTINIMIKNLTLFHFDPDELLTRLNAEMCALFDEGEDPELYACVFYAVVDTTARSLYFANAGLVLPLLVEADTGEVWELEATGPPIGMMRDAVYEQKTGTYRRGDMMLFYTDGLQDLYYKEHPEVFLRNLKDLLSDLCPREDMNGILDAVCHTFYKLDASANERIAMDDVSLLLCKLG